MVSDSTRPSDPPRTPLASLDECLVEAAPAGDLEEWFGEPDDVDETDELGADVVVTGITLSSQRVRPGDLYAALPGARTHGIAFADAALEAGAVAILTD
ncbi:MAG: UDP-N-acetylmuramoyl-L-alanyl-D-glutamate--2,6-diaminopimelate ligase, partial [Actinomycetales bacterium]